MLLVYFVNTAYLSSILVPVLRCQAATVGQGETVRHFEGTAPSTVTVLASVMRNNQQCELILSSHWSIDINTVFLLVRSA